MNRLLQAIESISDGMAYISAIALGLMTLLILLEIFLWNVFETTTLIADEYAAYGLAAIIFWGAGFCLKEKGHIRITLILGFLPPRLSRIVTWIGTVVAMLFSGYLWWFLFKMTLAAFRYGSTSGTLTHTPLWIPQGIMLLGATGFSFQLVAAAVKTFRSIQSGDDVF